MFNRRLTTLIVLVLSASSLAAQCLPAFEDVQRKLVDPGMTAFSSGDVDHDGVTDIAAVAVAGATLFRGRAAGGSEDGVVVSTRPVETIQLADVNGDGNLDLILFGGSYFTVALGDGRGGFAERTYTRFPALGRIRPMVTGRFTGPLAMLDVMAFDDQGSSIFTLKGHGDGTFDAPVKLSLTAGAIGTDPIVVDLDRDGGDDVLLVEYPSVSGVTILHNKGDGTFEKRIVPGNNVSAIAVADVSGDGIYDLVMLINSSVKIARGLGSLQFADPVTIGSLQFPSSHLLAADVNGDSRIDLILEDQIDRTIAVAYGNGDGTFPNVIVSDAAPIPLSELFVEYAASNRFIVALGYTSGEMVTWKMVCQKRRGARSR